MGRLLGSAVVGQDLQKGGEGIGQKQRSSCKAGPARASADPTWGTGARMAFRSPPGVG